VAAIEIGVPAMVPTFMTHLSLTKLSSIRLADVLRIGALMIDPRGRCNRQAMTVLTVAFVVIQLVSMLVANAIGGDFGVALFWIINAPIMVLGLVAVVKRLHDINLSGFWAPAACTLWIMAAFVATLVLTLIVGSDRMTAVVEEKSALYWLVFSFVFVPAFGGFIWLHSTPGTTGSNHFGPMPGDDGFGPGHGGRRTTDIPTDVVTAV
jgi:uncharacterized membrane protein YhaH (DUF805 family)